MSSLIFKKLRRPCFAATFMAGMLSNLVVFAEPASRAAHNLLSKGSPKEIRYSSLWINSNKRKDSNFNASESIGDSLYFNSHIRSNRSDMANIKEKGKKEQQTNTNTNTAKTDVFHPSEEYLVYYAQEKQGAIGVSENSRSDSGRDNYFYITLPEDGEFPGYIPILTYDLYGLTEASGTTKSINGSASYGGSMFESDNEWKNVEEYLPVELLKKGANEVFFNRRTDEKYGYQVRNVGIKFYKNSSPEIEENKIAVDEIISIDGALISERFELSSFDGERKAPFYALSLVPINEEISLAFSAKVSGLPFKDVKPLDQELVNVTAGEFAGYRIAFSENTQDTLELQLAFDTDKIPDGYTSKDVRTYYYDKQNKSWKALSLDSMDSETSAVISSLGDSGGETDYINGIIKVPEQPETANFVPTMLTDIEFANPSAGVVSIAPPSANNMGSVGTSFPIKLPSGRNGMQPSLEVAYNSEGGNGWMGMGWDLSMPSISLNTRWGVPEFDTQYESEIYSLNGQDLVLKLGEDYTSPHRDSNISRGSANRTFYLRKEGSYLEITRHGGSPANYYWEVKDKYGNKSFYGGVGSVTNTHVLRDSQGNSGNIIHWALVRQEDPYGNYVDYQYAKGWINEGGVSGWQFYIKTINYTMHSAAANNYYKVDFSRQTGRADKMTSARNRVFQITRDLLKKITVSYVNNGTNEKIRSYHFDYEEGPFKKQHLIKIAEYDSRDKLFYTNTMEYFDSPSKIISDPSETETWSGKSDDVSSTLQNIATGGLASQIPLGSVLGTSVSDGMSMSFRGGVGIGVNPTSVANTIGGSLSFSANEMKSRISLVDINGDGLPDKVYSKSSSVYYRPNTGSGFGSKIRIDNLNTLDQTSSRTNGGGFDANLFGLVSVGASKSTTRSTTDHFFIDYNGDGLPDVISNNRVKFNTTRAGSDNSWRDFNLDVNLSENHISSSALSEELLSEMNFETLEEIRANHPQFDHVKVWRAPYSGKINISESAKLLSSEPCGNPNEANKFKIFIEHARGEEVNRVIDRELIGTTPAGYNNLVVEKGDFLFFRIHNRMYGCGGEVQWNPKITYTATVPPENDEHGKLLRIYDAKEDFILNNGGGWSPVGEDFDVVISFKHQDSDFEPFQFSDDVEFIIEKIATNSTTGESAIETSWTKKRTLNHITGDFYAQGSNNTFQTNLSPNGDIRYSLHFYARSDSNLSWDTMDWRPQIMGDQTYYPSVSYVPYEDNIYQASYWVKSNSLPQVGVIPPGQEEDVIAQIKHNLFDLPSSYNSQILNSLLQNLNEDGELPLKVNWSLKEKSGSKTRTLHKTTVFLIAHAGGYTFSKAPNTFVAVDDSDYIFLLTKNYIKSLRQDQGVLYSAFYTENKKVLILNQTKITIESLPYTSPTMETQKINNPFFGISTEFFGVSYRGWGSFLYNGIFEDPIDPAVLTNNNPSFDPDTLQGQIDDIDPNTTDVDAGLPRHTLYIQNMEKGQYENVVIMGSRYGLTNNGKLTTTLGRFGERNLYNIYVNEADLFGGDGSVFIGLKQRSKSKGNATSYEAGVQVTDSESTSEVLNQYIDLNGDRYPDIVTGGKIQYSRMDGSLSPLVRPNDFISQSKNTDINFGVSIASMKSNSDNDKYMENPIVLKTAAGINNASGETSNAYQWIDMNGDGLPDKVRIEDHVIKVNLNMGYGFMNQYVVWGVSAFNIDISTRENLGIGVPLPTSSFAAGLGGGAGTSDVKTTLIDVNGDGLPDLIVNNSIYYLNTGVGFNMDEEYELGSNISTIERDFSISGNIYGAATVGFVVPAFLVPLKFTFSPSAGVNASLSEKPIAFRDINGDGLPDLLYKDFDDHNSKIHARLNQVGKTHLLKKVNLPLGGSWEVDYARVGNTYDMPQSKWVMKKLKTYDGFTADSQFGPDSTITKFSYKKGKHDRRDRDFLGFETVKTEQCDQNGITYRYTLQKYHNQNYYLKGALKESVTYTADNEILSRNRNFYNLVKPDINIDSNLNTDLEQPYMADVGNLDRSRIVPILVKTISTSYEGGQTLNAVQEFSKYDQWGNISKYINPGTRASDAYRTEITYNDPNFKGLPTEFKVFLNTDNSGATPLRHRTATYNAMGKLIKVTTHLNQNNTNAIAFEYDGFGNTTVVHQNDNMSSNGNDHFKINLEYDGSLHTYPVKTTDSYGQVSERVYNFLFGVPVLLTDTNKNKMRTRIDNRGRVIEITGPNEYNPLSRPDGWTIRNEYQGEGTVAAQIGNAQFNQYVFNAVGKFEARSNFQLDDPTNAQHHAITRHKDPLISGNEFLTVTTVDGLGQAIQLKKKHNVGGSTLKWQISGKEKKDDYGRVIEKYLPTVEAYNPSNVSYNALPSSIPPQLLEYDIRDRQIKITQPGEQASTTFAYSIESDRFLTTITNEDNQTQETHTDIRGRQRKVVQNNEITTEFFYNVINEQIKVRNNAGYETHYSYDMAGRRTQEQHPDRGTTKYVYDNASRLVEKQTSNLMQPGNTGSIAYTYDYGRMLEIKYPNHPENNVHYAYGTNTPANVQINAVGRLLLQQDATGIQQFEYGKMGELTRQVRAMAVAGKMSYWFDTQWKYDSWNRISKITYPDKEEVTYHYDPAGQLQSITTNLGSMVTTANPNIVSNISYTDLGERSQIKYGNGTVTNYAYDDRRRMNQLQHQFTDFQADRNYTYDVLSNITNINVATGGTNPEDGILGGPVEHSYFYDNFNRLVQAEGHYVGPDDSAPNMLKQAYSLDMTYDTAHNILEKHQVHRFGSVASTDQNLPQNAAHAPLTSYKLEYEGYGTGNISDGVQSYVQPHAPRKITEYPNGDYNGDPQDPRIKHKTIDYDADGNQLEIKQKIKDPENTQGYSFLSLRKNLWDEEDRLRAVDLSPENDEDKPLVAVYTYDANGERSIKYVPGRLDARYSAKEAGKADRLESMLYPNPLLSAKTLPIPEMSNVKDPKLLSYTKHYFIGSERISSVIGSKRGLGAYPGLSETTVPLNLVEDIVDAAGTTVQGAIAHFGKTLTLPQPFRFSSGLYNGSDLQDPENYAAFWYHPDHLGSSSYITNLSGEISQHMEYLPFGETLVEEHLNSNNSPYKFNAKEFDAETGNYYYGARYYDPKWSIWLSVDPLAEKFPSFTPYNYTFNNPIVFIDPDGRAAIPAYGPPNWWTSGVKKWNELNNKEKNIIRWDIRFYKAIRIEANADTASKMTKSTFGKNGKGDKSDAFRHAIWQALNTQEIGESFTEKWADAHEYSTPVDEIATDLIMDIHNNDLGIEIGKNNPDASPVDLQKIILDKIDNGEFLIINSDNELIKSNGEVVEKSEIRRHDTAKNIGDEIVKNPTGQKTRNYE